MERVGRSYGQRLSPLTRQDLPRLADAITMLLRKQGRVALHDEGDGRYVRLAGNGMNVLVLDRDWLRILPYLADGTLDPALNPAPTQISELVFAQFDSAWINLKDAALRKRILGVLTLLFPREYPTSKI